MVALVVFRIMMGYLTQAAWWLAGAVVQTFNFVGTLTIALFTIGLQIFSQESIVAVVIPVCIFVLGSIFTSIPWWGLLIIAMLPLPLASFVLFVGFVCVFAFI